MTIELRCESSFFGEVDNDAKTIEVRCKRRICGHAPGVIVLHTLSLETGKVIKTQKFQDFNVRKA